MGENKNRIRELRNAANMSGIQLASKLNISVQYLYDIERGKRTLSAENASKLSDIFNVTTDYLLGKTDVNLYDWIPAEELDEIKETPSQYSTEKEFVERIDLSDDELIKQFKIVVDGRELTQKEWKKLVAFVRMERDLE